MTLHQLDSGIYGIRDLEMHLHSGEKGSYHGALTVHCDYDMTSTLIKVKITVKIEFRQQVGSKINLFIIIPAA